MKKAFALGLIILCTISMGSTASASIFVTGLVNGTGGLPIPGNQPWEGQLGDDFTTTQAISISSIGVFDADGNGTTGDLVWQIFNVQTGELIHQETVGATGFRTPGNTIRDNYVFKTLAAPIVLAANYAYSAVAYGFDSSDMNFNTNFNLNELDVVFSDLGLNSAGGRFSMPSSDFSHLPMLGASYSASSQPYNFGAATFEYSVIPEAASLAVWLLFSCAGVFYGVSRMCK